MKVRSLINGCVGLSVLVAACARSVATPEPTTPTVSPTPTAAEAATVASPVAARAATAPATTPTPELYALPRYLLPRAVTSFGAAATSSHVYVLGGYFGAPHDYAREWQSSEFQALDRHSGEWSSLPSVGNIQSVTLTAYEGKLYRSGGMRVRNAQTEPRNLQSVDEFARYDPATGVWEDLPQLPEPRSSHDVVLVGSRLYVIGGWQLSGDPKSGRFHDTMAVIDLAEAQLNWRSLPVPFRTRALAAARLGNKLVVVGGMHSTREMSAETHLFDTRTETWSSGPTLDDSAFGASAVTLDGQVLASGPSGQLMRLRDDLSGWDAVGSLTFPRFFHRYVALADDTAHGGETVLAIGGISRAGRVRAIESVARPVPHDRVASFTFRAPARAKNRQGLFLKGSELYLFGGNQSLGQHDFDAQNFLTEAHRLNLASFEFEEFACFPVPRQSMQTAVVGDTGYAVGGFSPEQGKLATQADVFVYDFEADSWTRAEHGLPESHTQFGLIEHADALWIFGGLNFDDSRQEQFRHLTDVLRHDLSQPDSGFVDSGVDLPRPRRAFASALLDGRYYLIGGMAAGFELVDSVDVFDFATHTWHSAPAPRATRIGAELVPLNGKLYLIAGRSRGADGKLGEDKSIEVFDPATGSWSIALEQLPISDTHQLRAVPFNDRLLIYTAQREDDQVKLVVFQP